MTAALPRKSLTTRRVFHVWWPLAASWLLMAIELPALSAVVARLANPEINLAAYGGVVFPISLIIESPIIMLLAASTALSKDWASYVKLRRFMMWSGFLLTVLHLTIALTPLYYVVVVGIIGAPPEIVEPARIGLALMTPWTWSIAYRRFNQGVLIRFDESRAVGVGTIVRLVADGTVLAIGYLIGTIPGIVVATLAVSAGVMSEAAYIGLRVRPVLKGSLSEAPEVQPPLEFKAFVAFYVPLVMTSLLTMLVQPIGSAAVSRMPQALESLAVWPVIVGLIFMVRSMGMAYNEVVVALLDENGALKVLQRFTLILIGVATTVLTLIAVTPLAGLWFGRVSGLEPELVTLATVGIWFALPQPALNVTQSWYQGIILNSGRTRAITEAVGIFLVTIGAILIAGVVWGQLPGLYVFLVAYSLGLVTQSIWLWWRSQGTRRALHDRDTVPDTILTPADVPAK